MRIKIGTRGSTLALRQAHWVKDQLETACFDTHCEIVTIKTAGDRFTDMSLFRLPDKGFFTKDIEKALLSGAIDIAVHSAKDLPTKIPGELTIGAVPFRQLSNDVLITGKKYGTRERTGLRNLRPGAEIGTSSLRRKSQLLYFRRDFQIVDLRGNLDTRIKKLYTQKLDGIIVAYAGVKRLNLENKISEIIGHEIMLPAAGQGALALEIRRDDGDIMGVISTLNHGESLAAVAAERSFLKRLRAGCHAPVGACGRIEENSLEITGMVASLDGSHMVKRSVKGKSEDAERLGAMLAEELLDAGGAEILRALEKRGV